jgi:hypothetical protein
MADLELTRSAHDRRLYVLEGVGTLRLGGLFSRSGVAEAGGRRWTLARRGLLGRPIEAMGDDGAVVGAFAGRAIRRGGALHWGEREYVLRPASAWRERYALALGDRELALLDGKGWGKRPVRVTVDDPSALDPGLLLFAAFVVHAAAEDAGSAAAAGGSAAAAGS